MKGIIIGAVLVLLAASNAYAANSVAFGVTLCTNCAAVATPTPAPTPAPTVAGVTRANDFLNSLGANGNIVAGFDSATGEIAGFNYTGMRLEREEGTANIGPSERPGVYDMCLVHQGTQTSANPTGVQFITIPQQWGAAGQTSPATDPTIIKDQATYEEIAACGALKSLEGSNEPNNENYWFNGNYCDSFGSWLGCAQFMQALYAMHIAHTPNAVCVGPGESTEGATSYCTGAGTGTYPDLANYPVGDLSEPGAQPDNHGLQFTTIPSGAHEAPNGTIEPDGTVYADIANLHNYINGNGAAGTLADNQGWNAASRTGGGWDNMDGEYCGTTWWNGGSFAATPLANCTQPFITTETGYQSNECNAFAEIPGAPTYCQGAGQTTICGGGNINPTQQGNVEMDFYGDNFVNGATATYTFLLFDNPCFGGFGFFNPYSGTGAVSPKPVATEMHNLTTIIADTSSGFTPTVPNGFSVTGLNSVDHYLLLQNSNGLHELLVWGEAFISQTKNTVTVNFGSSRPSVNTYDINVGTTPTATASNVNSVPVTLIDHMMVVTF